MYSCKSYLLCCILNLCQYISWSNIIITYNCKHCWDISEIQFIDGDRKRWHATMGGSHKKMFLAASQKLEFEKLMSTIDIKLFLTYVYRVHWTTEPLIFPILSIVFVDFLWSINPTNWSILQVISYLQVAWFVSPIGDSWLKMRTRISCFYQLCQHRSILFYVLENSRNYKRFFIGWNGF